MSIYTSITLDEANIWLGNYHINKAQELKPIHHGTVNSNYYLHNKDTKYILTIFETLKSSQIEEILKLTQYLAKHKLTCPKPIPNHANKLLTPLKNKPAALIECLPGNSIEEPSERQCAQIGTWLAKMHLTTQSYPHDIVDTMGISWQKKIATALFLKLTKTDANLLEQTQKIINHIPYDCLPNGIIHADLFRDNALFVESKLSGVIDFYFACNGSFAYDLAIMMLDWCITSSGKYNQNLYDHMLNSYSKHRPLTKLEQQHWHNIQVLAASRFWLSRLQSKLFPIYSSTVLIKDPNYFKNILTKLCKTS